MKSQEKDALGAWQVRAAGGTDRAVGCATVTGAPPPRRS